MSRIPQVSGERVVRALEKIGFVVVKRHGGSGHVKMRREGTGGVRQTIVPMHRVVKPPLLRAIVEKDAGITIEEFKELL